jgi:hypothetical protein
VHRRHGFLEYLRSKKMHQRSLLLPGNLNFRCLSCLTRKFILSSLSKHFCLRFFSSF